MNIDMEFLQAREGYTNYGTIPKKGDGTIAGRSGVTIGIGIDLGQQDERSLREAGMSPETVRILKPYLGLKGEEAQKVLDRIPLAVSPDVASRLSEGIMVNGLDKLITKFNKGSSIPFDELTPKQQTVLYSVTHQYGINGAPKFLKYAQEGKWDKVAKELYDFGDDQQVSRNRLTGEYLEDKI